MWYRQVIASLPGVQGNSQAVGEKTTKLDSEVKDLNVPPDQLYPELEKMLKDLNFDPEEYESLPDHARKNIWDIIVHKYDTNLYNNFEDSDTPGFDATEARRHSPYHSNPSETTLEALSATDFNAISCSAAPLANAPP